LKRILVLNNYSINRVEQEINERKKPSHHLYGVIELKKSGYIISTIETDKKSFIFKFGYFLSFIPLCNLGDLFQQIKAIQKRKEYDIVYALSQDVTTFLGLLSYFGLYKKPLIALIHHPILRGRLSSIRKYSTFFSLSGHTYLPALSSTVAKQINTITKKNTSFEIKWGPDINYYNLAEVTTNHFINDIDLLAIGRTGRDYATLINAFNNTNIRVVVFCDEGNRNIIPTEYTSNIEINWLPFAESLDYNTIIGLYHKTKIIAIPMFDQDSLCGLTSITDAIALGKPIIITRNKYINIDPALNKFGMWVSANNENDWRNAADSILTNTLLFEEMSVNAKSISLTEYNIDSFADKIEQLINQSLN